jgi:acyl-CoA synthetase (AMP-forming)/AMP-acid ligase II
MVNRGGEKVNPQEVEDVLMSHPAVAQAACFAVSHAALGENLAAAVVLEASAQVTEQALHQFAASRLAPFKVPRQIIFLTRLPLNATGKTDRLVLSQFAEAQPGSIRA